MKSIVSFFLKYCGHLWYVGLILAFLAMIVGPYADHKFWWTFWDVVEVLGFAVAAGAFGALVSQSGEK